MGRYHAAARAFKYQLMPNGEQQRQMRRFAGARRFVFNKALALQKANDEAGERASRASSARDTVRAFAIRMPSSSRSMKL
jgi:putative transposase